MSQWTISRKTIMGYIKLATKSSSSETIRGAVRKTQKYSIKLTWRDSPAIMKIIGFLAKKCWLFYFFILQFKYRFGLSVILLTPFHKEVLVGTLLGDARLERAGLNQEL